MQHFGDAELHAGPLALRILAADDDSLPEAVTAALAAVGERFGVDRAYVTRFNDDATLDNGFEWTAKGVVPHARSIRSISIHEFPYSTSLARSGHIFRAPDIDLLPPQAEAERHSFAAFGVGGVLEIPVLVGQHVLGTVGVNRLRESDRWAPDTLRELERTLRSFSAVIGVALDRQLARARLKAALVAAERASRAKDTLIASASHELRTPLHAILGFGEILALDGVNHEAVEQIRANGHLLLNVVDELLGLAHLIDHGPQREPSELRALLDDTVQLVQPDAEARNVTIVVERNVASAAPSTPTTLLRALPRRTEQIVHCVLSAAIAQARDARVTVSLGDNPHCDFVVRFATTIAVPTGGLRLAFAQSLLDESSGHIEERINEGVDGTDHAIVVRVCSGERP